MHKIHSSTSDKNLKSDTGVRPDNKKSKAAELLEKSYLYQGWGKPTKQAEPLYPFILYSLS